METLQLNIEKSQFVDLLQTLSIELSMENITETVEEVRQERYEKGNQTNC